MVWVAGPCAITAAVLVVGGMLSLRDSRPARDALAALGVPAPRLVAHLAGPAEVAVGGVALVLGGWLPAVAVTATYLVFVGVLAVQLQHDGPASCGCFGRLSARPSPVHLVTDSVAAIVAAVAVASDPPGLLALWRDAPSPAEGVLLVGLVALATALVVVVLTVLPATSEAARPGAGGTGPRTFEIHGTPR